MLIWPINPWAANPVVDCRADVKDSEINLQVLTGKAIHSMCGVVVLVAQLCLTLCNPWTVVCQVLCPWKFPGKNAGMGCHSILQGTQGSNLGLPHCRQILYHLIHQGSP